jgi:hypothetical protein
LTDSKKILYTGNLYDMLKEKGETAMKCSECQNEIPEGSVFCPVCGSAQFGEPVEVISTPVVEAKEEPAPVTKITLLSKWKKKWWILAAAAGVLAAVVALAALVIFANRPPEYAVYATLDSLMLRDLSGGEPVRLAGNISLREMLLTKDEKRLFYLVEKRYLELKHNMIVI